MCSKLEDILQLCDALRGRGKETGRDRQSVNKRTYRKYKNALLAFLCISLNTDLIENV